MVSRSFIRVATFAVAGLVGASAFADIIMPTGSAATDTANIKNALAAGGVVELGEGEFLIKEGNGISVGSATLKGQGWEKTILKASPGTTFYRAFKVSGGKIEGVTVTGFNGSYRGAGIYVESGTVSWCCVSNNTSTANSANNAAGAGIGILRGTIDHCLVANNKLLANSNGYGAGIGSWAVTGDITIDTCLVYGNENMVKPGGGIGIQTLNGKNVKISNCTVYGNAGKTSGAGVYVYDGETASLTMQNCIVAGNTVDGTEANFRTYSAFYPNVSNSIFGLASELASDMVDCSSDDPGFVDAANGDFHLSRTSSAIAAGMAYSGMGRDLDNVEFNPVPSIGCYEVDLGVARPVSNPKGGRTFYPDLDVTLTCGTEGATIRYTTDGSEPTSSSAVYAGPIHLTETTTIKAAAFADGLGASAIASETYTYALPTAPDFTLKLSPWSSTLTIDGSITALGNNGATACDVYLAYGLADGTMGEETKIASDVKLSFRYVISGLTPETSYQYSIRVVNNTVVPQAKTTSATFVTLSANTGILPVAGDPALTRQRLQDAIDAAPNGIVYLAERTFEIDDQLVINNGASLVGAEGADRAKVILSQVSAEKHVLWIENSPDTIVSNLTVTAGKNAHAGIVMNSGVVDSCVIRDIETKNNETGSNLWPYSAGNVGSGAGVNMFGGVLRNSIVTRCNGQDSAGAGISGEGVFLSCGALVENCEITDCGQKNGGGSAYWGGAVCIRRSGTVRGCLVANNLNRVIATGVAIVPYYENTETDKIVVENCTIVGNQRNVSDSAACGLAIGQEWGKTVGYNVTVRNNIIWGNLAADGETEANYNLEGLDPATCVIECNDTRPALSVGTSNLSVDPLFADAQNGDYHLGLSYCVDAGSNQDWMFEAVDLDGNDRILNTTVDMGCYEYAAGSDFQCRMQVVSDGALDASLVTLTCDCTSSTAESAQWRLTRQQDGYVVTASGFVTTVTLEAGLWDVHVTVTEDTQTAVADNPGAVDVRASVAYANVNGSDTFPFDTLEKGSPSLTNAYAVVGIGGTLLVGEGNYVLDAPITIDAAKGSRIESISGPENTIIRLADVAAFKKDAANVGFKLGRSDAFLGGLTITGGLASDDYDGPEYPAYGLVKVDCAGAMVTNCVLRDFKAISESAGSGNNGHAFSLLAGTVVDCRVSRVENYRAGGAISDRGGVVSVVGGLADRIRVEDCWDKSADNIAANGRGDIVGVLGSGVLRNSLVTRCTSNHDTPVYVGAVAGGESGGAMINCTIVANTNTQTKVGFHRAAVALNGGVIVNCIIADNCAQFGGESGEPVTSNLISWNENLAGVSYTLVDDREGDEDFLAEDKHNINVTSLAGLFRKAEKGDYTLPTGSPAVNVGLEQEWMEGAVDLLGRARILSRIPDLGCYECRASGFAIRLR